MHSGGVAQEASALAGHLHLDNLIVFYDSNDVTLDAMAEKSQSEDTAKRYEAMGWGVVTIDGHDLDAVAKAFSVAKAATGKPQLIIAKTEIARGIPEVAGTSAGHGESGAIKHSENAHQILGLPEDRFHVSEDVRAYFAELKQARIEVYNTWKTTYDDGPKPMASSQRHWKRSVGSGGRRRSLVENSGSGSRRQASNASGRVECIAAYRTGPSRTD